MTVIKHFLDIIDYTTVYFTKNKNIHVVKAFNWKNQPFFLQCDILSLWIIMIQESRRNILILILLKVIKIIQDQHHSLEISSKCRIPHQISKQYMVLNST